MFTDFFLFELKLRFKSVSTYVFFLLAAILPFFSVAAQGFGPAGSGKVLLNGPYAVLLITTLVTAYGSILVAAIFGPAILRDFQQWLPSGDDALQVSVARALKDSFPYAPSLGRALGAALPRQHDADTGA